jgi:hypothetical protein
VQIIVTPFHRPAPTTVHAGPWINEASQEPVPERLITWDVATEIVLRRRVRVNLDGVLADCHLSPASTLYVSCFWRASLTSLVGRGTLVLIHRPAEGPVELQMRVSPGEAGEMLTLGTVVCLHDPADTRDDLAPRDPGAVLWEDAFQVALEGEAPRFPVSTANFQALGWPRDAAWQLVWQHRDLDVSPSVAFRLYVNTLHPLAVSSLQGDDPASQGVRSMLQADLARSILTFALREEVFTDTDWGKRAGTLGHVAAALLARIFPDESAHNLASRLDLNPDRFWCQVQAGLQFLGGITR